MHMMSEAMWYETTIQYHATNSISHGNPSVQILDDHAHPRAALLNSEGVIKHSQLVKEALEKDNSAGEWKCRHCLRVQGRKWELILHLKSK